ncbi:MAG TPA: DedA family protein [Acidimicrobiales bacterium]|nr:DedA family protein [Acidimicrobiales bacterium]
MEHVLATWGYLALFAVTFLSAMGLPVGSELAIASAGALASGQVLAGHRDHLSLGLVILLATLGEVLGSSAGYAIGLFGGRPLVDRVGKYVLLTHRDLDRAEAWFARRGDTFVFVGRFVPLLRSFVSLAAGLGEMARAKFLAFTLVGCAMWCAALSSVGYSLGASWHRVVKDFSYAGYVAAALAVVAVAVVFAHRVRAVRTEQAAARADVDLGLPLEPTGTRTEP